MNCKVANGSTKSFIEYKKSLISLLAEMTTYEITNVCEQCWTLPFYLGTIVQVVQQRLRMALDNFHCVVYGQFHIIIFDLMTYIKFEQMTFSIGHSLLSK